MYSASSAGRRVGNRDGTFNIYCRDCTQFIATTHQRVGSAQCEMCRRVEAGEPITEELIKHYEAGRLGHSDVSLLVLADPTPKELRKFSLGSLAGNFFRALGFQKPVEEVAASTVIAKTKRRGRLFDSVELGKVPAGDKKK